MATTAVCRDPTSLHLRRAKFPAVPSAAVTALNPISPTGADSTVPTQAKTSVVAMGKSPATANAAILVLYVDQSACLNTAFWRACIQFSQKSSARRTARATRA